VFGTLKSNSEHGLEWYSGLQRFPVNGELVQLTPYKNKDDIQDCNNYRGIKLLSYTMKLWERAIETKLRRDISILKNQDNISSPSHKKAHGIV